MTLNSNDIAGMFAMLMLFGVPTLGMFLKHQRKMAELYHLRGSTLNPETQALREEIRELKSLVHEQTIALDGLVRPIPTEPRLQERVG